MLGAGVNYKWVEGFLFEGSPQFTGSISSYGLVDAQCSFTQIRNKNEKKTTITYKIGASNALNNQVYQVFGGVLVEGWAYLSIQKLTFLKTVYEKDYSFVGALLISSMAFAQRYTEIFTDSEIVVQAGVSYEELQSLCGYIIKCNKPFRTNLQPLQADFYMPSPTVDTATDRLL